MKMFKLLILVSIFSLTSVSGISQSIKERIAVPGNCGMCKSKIEAAAKKAGATYASWDEEAKVLSIQQKGGKAGNMKIQQAVAEAGYDTPVKKASTEAYSKLHECCKYERVAANNEMTDTTTCVQSGDDHSACGNGAKPGECCNGEKCPTTSTKTTEGASTQKTCCKQS